ncbi:MAG: T9SS type A sorting domain-containing protein [Saprospiraceae bacterium]|nr:T9SS type A sorting domain-containing protein [Saprospiraceae bacterium]
MRKLLIIFFTSIIINPGFTQSYTNHQILSYSGSNANIRVWVSASTSFGMGVSGGLSTDGGANYPYGWGPFNNNVSNPGPGSGTWYRDFTLPTSSTNIGSEFKICDFGTTNNCSPKGSNFTPGTISGPLPIALKNFEVQNIQNNIKMYWSTASETNNDYFEILHSTTGKDFQVIGMVKGVGNSNTIQQYRFTHENPARGRSFYRLRQVDYDGKYEYSPVRSVVSDLKIKEIHIAPNPASDLVSIIHDGSSSTFDISIKDITGRTIIDYKNYSAETLDISPLSSGLYTITIIADGVATTQRLIKE